MGVPSSRNSTFPVGVPSSLSTVAVRVTLVPLGDGGFGSASSDVVVIDSEPVALNVSVPTEDVAVI